MQARASEKSGSEPRIENRKVLSAVDLNWSGVEEWTGGEGGGGGQARRAKMDV
jgi:hypothetical protein